MQRKIHGGALLRISFCVQAACAWKKEGCVVMEGDREDLVCHDESFLYSVAVVHVYVQVEDAFKSFQQACDTVAMSRCSWALSQWCDC